MTDFTCSCGEQGGFKCRCYAPPVRAMRKMQKIIVGKAMPLNETGPVLSKGLVEALMSDISDEVKSSKEFLQSEAVKSLIATVREVVKRDKYAKDKKGHFCGHKADVDSMKDSLRAALKKLDKL